MKSLICWAILGTAGGVAAAGPGDAAFFESKIRPLLTAKCYECHSEGKARKGGLLLDSPAGWRAGGDSGRVIVPGEPDGSLLIRAVRGDEADLVMPPPKSGGPLTAAEIADLTAWVKSGAHDPRSDTAAAAAAEKAWEEAFTMRLQWWSLKPVQAPEPPPAVDGEWSHSPVDRFLRAAMQRRGLTPAVAASPETFLRRACLVLTGLPPSPAEVREFLREAAVDYAAARGRLIERLLASPHFGERFARHWLDVVRFSETHGNEWNYDAAYAWRYRDYVIRAFNDDVPYDRLVREHIAGDLVTPRPGEGAGFDVAAVGTAFYRFGEVNHDSCTQFPIIGYDILDNQLDTLTKAFQATTVACARCHDHKMDAVSTRDYHSLLAVLRSSRPVMRTLDPESNREATATLTRLKSELRAELAAVWTAGAQTISVDALHALADAVKDNAPPRTSPLHVWFHVRAATPADFGSEWTKLRDALAADSAAREEFNRTNFTTLADFREGTPEGWTTDGHGLRSPRVEGGDFVPAHEGGAAVKAVLPAGLFTFSLSDRLNGALRSPTLKRRHAKVSFEVTGGRFSLARLVFNNCQFNYDRQHSIHHDAWSWVTIDWPEKTDDLAPYAELLTFWDNPKFPDPLGTLGKDTENQREPHEAHAKNPRSWWGLRRIVTHDAAETPKPELAPMLRLFDGAPPPTLEEAAQRYAAIAGAVVAKFAAGAASDDDMAWLDWLVRSGLLANDAAASPRLAELSARYRDVENRLALPVTLPVLADEGLPLRQPVFDRGDITKPGEPVPRGVMRMLAPNGLPMPDLGSGRRELAELIASPSNPLTARVMVNRVWLWIFGRGLVNTPDDFGHLGEKPRHPELLDSLAARFVAEGWSVKKLVRELAMNRVFLSDSRPAGDASTQDPENHTLSHFPARRAQAEVIRDSLLAVSGCLDRRLFGPSVHPYREKADPEKRLFTGPLDGDGRRSLYIKFQLMEQPAFLRAFNLPGGKVTEGRREASNTPDQSLAMLNDPLVLKLADEWASRLLQDGATEPADRVRGMFLAAFSREATAAETARILAGLGEFAAVHGVPPDALMSSREVWGEAAHTLFNMKEFIFIP